MKTPEFTHEDIEASRTRMPGLRGPVGDKVFCIVAGLLFENSINDILHLPDEEKEWAALPVPVRHRNLDDATYFLCRLQMGGLELCDSQHSIHRDETNA